MARSDRQPRRAPWAGAQQPVAHQHVRRPAAARSATASIQTLSCDVFPCILPIGGAVESLADIAEPQESSGTQLCKPALAGQLIGQQVVKIRCSSLFPACLVPPPLRPRPLAPRYHRRRSQLPAPRRHLSWFCSTPAPW